jgi:phospholipid transport system substrate-binding protein
MSFAPACKRIAGRSVKPETVNFQLLRDTLMKNLIRFAALGTFFALAALAAELGPDDLVKRTSDEVLGIVKQDKDIQAGNRQKIFALVDAKVLPHFDFTRMTRLAMGRNWRNASPEQQQTLVKEFRDLLVRTYAVALAQYRDQKIEYKPTRLQPNDTETTVRTEIIQSGTEPVSIYYDMEKTPDGWKVYNIVVGGVSLVTNYRSEFNGIIAQSGIDGLINRLKEKNRTGSTEKPQSSAASSGDHARR